MAVFTYNPSRAVEILSVRILREVERHSAWVSEQSDKRAVTTMVDTPVRAAAENDPGDRLMLALQGGDRRALHQLIQLYNARLYNFVRRIVNDGGTTEDLIQETWLSLYQRRDSYESGYKFTTWLFTIARRKALSELRRRKVRSIVRSLTFSNGNGDGEEMELPQETFSQPDASANGALLANVIQEALERLSPAQREIIILRDMEGFENEEVANILQWDINPGAVRKRVFDARAAFRKAMLELGYREE